MEMEIGSLSLCTKLRSFMPIDNNDLKVNTERA